MRSSVKTISKATAILAFCLCASIVHAQENAAPSPVKIEKTIEAYLRNLYAFGSDVVIVVGAPKESPVSGLLEISIDVTIADNKQTVKFFVSKDGKYLFQGELSDLTKDPLLENRKRIQMKDSPMLGDPNAPVTIVEYSDFECPVCRNLHDALRGMLPNYPQVRVIFKDFPIEQIHPWARTAALAGRCAYNQDPKSFWKIYDLIYDNQEIISADNAWTKMVDYASQSGLNADTFKTCLASPDAAAAIDASRLNGEQLEVSSTPTIFVNGRRIVGADPHALEQYIKYELTTRKPASSDKR
jgi:predicted DsbA family dithiol-disulfide isomerase